MENSIINPATGATSISAGVLAFVQGEPTAEVAGGQELTLPPPSKAHKIAELLSVPLPKLFEGRTPRQCDLLLQHFRYEEESEGHRCSFVDIFRAVALAPEITGPDTLFKTSIGAMRWDDEQKKARQDIREAKGIETTPRRLVAWARGNVSVGPKAQAKVLYPAYLEHRRDTHKTNALMGQLFVFDHDAGPCPVTGLYVASLDTPARKAAWKQWLPTQGMHFGFTTSSNGAPHKGGHTSMSAILWLKYALPAPLLALVGAKAREAAARAVDVDLSEPDWDGKTRTPKGAPLRKRTRAKCLDEITSRPVQARYTVKHADASLAALYEDEFDEDLPVKDPTEWLDLVVADLEVAADKAEEAARRAAERQKFLGLKTTDIQVGVAVSPRQDWARKTLDEHGAAVSGSDGDTHTFLACLIGWKAGLDLDDFWDLLLTWNSTCLPPWDGGELRRRLERVYKTSTIPFGCAFSSRGLSLEELTGVPMEDVEEKEEPFSDPPPKSVDDNPEEFRSDSKGEMGIKVTRICRRYLSILKSFSHLPHQTTFIRSHYGTGKNHSLAEAIREVAQSPLVACLPDAGEEETSDLAGAGVTVYNSRRSLVRSSAGAWGLPTHLESEVTEIVGSIVACVHSAQRVVSGNSVIIIDDSESVAQAVFHGPLRTKGLTPHILNALKGQIAKASHVLYSDAGLGAATICFARLLNGTLRHEDRHLRSEHHIINTYKPKTKEVYHIWSDYDGWIEELCRAIENRESYPNIWVSFTSKNQLLIIEKLLKNRFPELSILAVHQDSCHKKAVREALDTPSLFKNYRVILASPTAGTGVSVDDVDTWKNFGFGISGSGPSAKDFAQQVHRPRHPIGPIQVCLTGYSSTLCSDVAKLVDRKSRNNEATLADLQRLGTSWDTRLHADGTVQIEPDDADLVFVDAVLEADRNQWGGTFGNMIRRDEDGNVTEVIEGSFVRLLREQDAEILYIGAVADDPKAAKKERQEVAKEVSSERLDLIRSLPAMSLEEAQKAVLSPEPPEHASLILAAAQHRDFFGKHEDEAIEEDQLKRDTPRYRKAIRLVAHVEATFGGYKQEVRAKDKRALLENGHTCNIRHDGLVADFLVKVLKGFGITDGLEKSALAGTVVSPPPESWLTRELCLEANDVLGNVNWHPEMGVNRAFRSIMDRLCLTLKTKSNRVNGVLVRERKIPVKKLDTLLADGKAYKRRLFPDRTFEEMFANEIGAGMVILIGSEEHRKLREAA